MSRTSEPEILEHSVIKARQWIDETAVELGTEDDRAAFRALNAVMHAVRDRITVNEAAQLAAQLLELIRGAFAAGFSPRPVTYRTIDFRTNEFRGLKGGGEFEPEEANPMIGYRGAQRYVREPDLLQLELDAIGSVHDAVSVSVDAVDRTRRLLAAAEQRLLLEAARQRA